MFVRAKNRDRIPVGRSYEEVIHLPNLIDIQLSSYERFLQLNAIENARELELHGLQEVFKSTFPIESMNGDIILEFHEYIIDRHANQISEKYIMNRSHNVSA